MAVNLHNSNIKQFLVWHTDNDAVPKDTFNTMVNTRSHTKHFRHLAFFYKKANHFTQKSFSNQSDTDFSLKTP